MDNKREVFQDLIQRANAGTLANATLEELQRFSRALCSFEASPHGPASQFPQICETVRLLLLQKHLESLEARSSRYEGLIIALAVASLIASIVQIWVAIAAT